MVESHVLVSCNTNLITQKKKKCKTAIKTKYFFIVVGKTNGYKKNLNKLIEDKL